MSWEIAVIIGQLALPVFLILSTFVLDKESRTYVPLKALLFIVAFFLMLNVPSTLKTVVDAQTIDEAAAGNLTLKIESNFTVWTYLDYTVMAYIVIAFLYWLIMLFSNVATPGKKRFEE